MRCWWLFLVGISPKITRPLTIRSKNFK